MAKASEWLVVSDVDGTFNNKYRRTPAVNLSAIEHFAANGGSFTLASGRCLSSLKPQYEKLNGNAAPAIYLNGAGIYDFSAEKVLSFTAISKCGTSTVFELASKYSSVEMIVFTDDCVHLVRPRAFGYVTTVVDNLSYEKHTSLFEVPHGNWGKVTFFAMPPTIKRIMADVLSVADSGLSPMLTSPYTIEIMADGVNKGTAVIKLAELLGVDMCHTAAIGDYYNDLDMLKAVRLAACCRQAPAEVKAVSQYCACHCDDGAVADLLGYLENNYLK